MKRKSLIRLTIRVTFILSIFLTTGYSQENTDHGKQFPVLKGPYLGQKPPGMTPEILAPGIVSTSAPEFGSTFSADGNEFYYAISGVPITVVAFMQLEKNGWSQPAIAPFSGKYGDWDLNFSPDGKELFYTSNRPLSGEGERADNSNLWVVSKTESGWSEPEYLGSTVNTDGSENYPSVTEDGTLYFFHTPRDRKSDCDIYYSRIVNGEYTKPVRVGDKINSDYDEWDPFIAPDESYIIFCSVDRPDGYGDSDLYISFRKEDGSWTEAVNMGEKFNTREREICPNVTADGKYFLFTSKKWTSQRPYLTRKITYKEKMRILNGPGNGQGDIYWVDTRIINELKPKELK